MAARGGRRRRSRRRARSGPAATWSGIQELLHLPRHGVQDRVGATPSATSVATRRSAACSSASRFTSASALRRSVMSRATAYISRFSTSGVAVHSSNPDRAVLADVPVLERHGLLALRDRGRLRHRAVAVGRMDEVDVWVREELFLRVAEDLHRGRVHTREPRVEIGNHDQILGHGEDAVELRLALPRRAALNPSAPPSAGTRRPPARMTQGRIAAAP